MQVEQPGQFRDRRGMVVDAQVDEDVTAAAISALRSDDEQRSALPAATIAAGVVACGQPSQ